MTEKYTIDRIEGNKAVLLLRRDESIKVDVPIIELPKEINEGDIVAIKFDEQQKVISVTILNEETTDVRERIKKLQQNLLDKNNKI